VALIARSAEGVTVSKESASRRRKKGRKDGGGEDAEGPRRSSGGINKKERNSTDIDFCLGKRGKAGHRMKRTVEQLDEGKADREEARGGREGMGTEAWKRKP